MAAIASSTPRNEEERRGLTEGPSRGSYGTLSDASSRTASRTSSLAESISGEARCLPKAADFDIKSYEELKTEGDNAVQRCNTVKWIGVALLVVAVAAALICFAPHVGLLVGSAALAIKIAAGGAGAAGLLGAGMIAGGHFCSPHRTESESRKHSLPSIDPKDYPTERLKEMKTKDLLELSETAKKLEDGARYNFTVVQNDICARAAPQKEETRMAAATIRRSIYEDLDKPDFRARIAREFEARQEAFLESKRGEKGWQKCYDRVLRGLRSEEPLDRGQEIDIFGHVFENFPEIDSRMGDYEALQRAYGYWSSSMQADPAYRQAEAASREACELVERVNAEVARRTSSYLFSVRDGSQAMLDRAGAAHSYLTSGTYTFLKPAYYGLSAESMDPASVIDQVNASHKKGEESLKAKLEVISDVMKELQEKAREDGHLIETHAWHLEEHLASQPQDDTIERKRIILRTILGENPQELETAGFRRADILQAIPASFVCHGNVPYLNRRGLEIHKTSTFADEQTDSTGPMDLFMHLKLTDELKQSSQRSLVTDFNTLFAIMLENRLTLEQLHFLATTPESDPRFSRIIPSDDYTARAYLANKADPRAVALFSV